MACQGRQNFWRNFLMRRIIFILSIILTMAIVGCTSSPTPTPLPPTATIVIPTATPQAQAASSAAQAPASAATPLPVKEVKVEAMDDYFQPEKITITVGTKVTWVNVGTKKHNVTYDDLFDQDFNPGETFSYTFDKAGVYQYYCVQHALSETEGMVGTITVVAP